MDKFNTDAKRQAILDMFKDACPYNGQADQLMRNDNFNNPGLKRPKTLKK